MIITRQINVEIGAGTSITEASFEMINCARQHPGAVVCSIFNGCGLTATDKNQPEDIVEQFVKYIAANNPA